MSANEFSMLKTCAEAGVDPAASWLARTAGMTWPPPPTIALRSLVTAPAVEGFSTIIVDPSALASLPDPINVDPCVHEVGNPASPNQLLPFGYQFPQSDQFPNMTSCVEQGSEYCVQYVVAPWTSQYVVDPGATEPVGRLVPQLRQAAQTQNVMDILTLAVEETITAQGQEPMVSIATAISQLAVTGRRSFEQFAKLQPQDGKLASYATSNNASLQALDPAVVASACTQVLDQAYLTLWAIRSNEPGWRAFRDGHGWIAVSGIDDTPHRPVNVPTGPYPQFDIDFSVPTANGSPLPVTTRYMVAAAGLFVGATGPTSFFANPGVPAAPATPVVNPPAPRSVPDDEPAIPADAEIIIYIHGGGSRAEEAVGLANWLIIEGAAAGQNYAVISFDLPNSAYGSGAAGPDRVAGAPFDVTDIVGPTYHPTEGHIRNFEQQYIINFIEALDQQLGNVKDRIVAVMGGSLGGNMGLLLSQANDADHQYLNTIVAWSPTCAAPSSNLPIFSNGFLSAYFGGLKDQATSPELEDTESSYITNLYFMSLNPPPPPGVGGPPYIPPQPLMWYRGADDWQPCKRAIIPQTRFDRYEIYSETMRHWAAAIDLEQVYLSFQELGNFENIAAADGSQLLLATGAGDNYTPVNIYNNTIDLANLISTTAHCRAEFWQDTGHSIHDERPHLFAMEIVNFLTLPWADGSPYGYRVTTGIPTVPNSPTNQ